MRPRKLALTEVDGGRVQRISGVVEVHAEMFGGVELARLEHQSLRQLGIDASVVALVSLDQNGTPHGRMKAHGGELGGLCAQTSFNVTQALAIRQLGKGHGTELLGTSVRLHTRQSLPQRTVLLAKLVTQAC